MSFLSDLLKLFDELINVLRIDVPANTPPVTNSFLHKVSALFVKLIFVLLLSSFPYLVFY